MKILYSLWKKHLIEFILLNAPDSYKKCILKIILIKNLVSINVKTGEYYYVQLVGTPDFVVILRQ